MKSIFDYKHVKGTTAICLLNAKTNEYCGRIVANWSDNPAGSVCSAAVLLYGNSPIKLPETGAIDCGECVNRIGTAGSYGYDKLSQAIWGSLKAQGPDKIIEVRPASGNQREAFEKAGFVYIEVC